MIARLFERGSARRPRRANSDGVVERVASKSVDLTLPWIVRSAGAVVFVTLQAFAFLNAHVKSGGADGLRDGGRLVGLEVLAVTLPGSVAPILSGRHIRAN